MSSLSVYLSSRLRGLFRDVTVNTQKRAKQERLPKADRTYVVMFTPRSGSSRLTDILRQTRKLGEPGEAFNPGFVPRVAQSYGATNLDEYLDAMRRRRNTDGVMGFKITYSHILSVFGTSARFCQIAAPDYWFWLIREDIVLQAISVSRARQSKIHHDTGLDAERLTKAEDGFTYDRRMIFWQLAKLVWMERQTERFFRRFGLAPVRLSYEMLSMQEPQAIADLFARTVGQDLSSAQPLNPTHQKLGTEKNLVFADRFRSENKAFMRVVDKMRTPILAALSSPFSD